MMINKSDLNGLYFQFKTLVEQRDKTYDRIINEKEWDYSFSSHEDESFKSSLRRGDLLSFYHIYNSAKKLFYDLKKEIGTAVTLEDLPKPVKDYNFSLLDTIAILNVIKNESKKAMGILEKAIFPISVEEVNKLDSMRKDLSKFYPKIQEDYEKNIEKAIEEYKCGHLLASTLISSRVIISAIENIEKYIKKAEGKFDREDKTEKIIKFVIEKGLIEKHRDTNQQILKASRLARNRFTHNIKSYPDSGDPLSLLDGCLKFVMILSKLKEL